MRTARVLAAVVLGAVVTLSGGIGTAAAKDPEHAERRSLTVAPQTLHAGGSITVSGICPAGAGTANTWFRGGTGMPIADNNALSVDRETGHVTGALIVPTHTPPGMYRAWLACADSESTFTRTFVVADGGAPVAAVRSQAVALGGGMAASAVIAGAVLAWGRHRTRAAHSGHSP